MPQASGNRRKSLMLSVHQKQFFGVDPVIKSFKYDKATADTATVTAETSSQED